MVAVHALAMLCAHTLAGLAVAELRAEPPVTHEAEAPVRRPGILIDPVVAVPSGHGPERVAPLT